MIALSSLFPDIATMFDVLTIQSSEEDCKVSWMNLDTA